MRIVDRNPRELKNHLLNIRIYGEHIDADFLESTSHGIESPLTVCRSSDPGLNDVVVKGRRRRMAAIKHGFKTVPCIIWECDDPLEVERQLIVDNVRNETTVEERARMFEELKRIENEKSARIKKANLKVGQDMPGSEVAKTATSGKTSEKPSKSRDKAASAVGMKPRTAEQAAAVVHAADAIRESGDEETADEIIETLNHKSVAAAARVAAEAVDAPKAADEDADNSRDIDRLTAKLVGLCSQLEKASGELFVAIDQKKKTSKPFANRHAKFAGYIRKAVSLLEPLQQQCGVMSTAWAATKKQVDE